MARRPYDTSRAFCDTCGKPYQEGDAVYAVADKYDEDIEDRDVLVSFRHWDCHTPIDVTIKNARKAIDEAEQKFHSALDRLRSKLK